MILTDFEHYWHITEHICKTGEYILKFGLGVFLYFCHKYFSDITQCFLSKIDKIQFVVLF